VTDLFLGTIAVAVLVMAILQVAVVVWAARTARRVGAAVERLEHGVRPIVASLQTIAADVAKATALAVGQVERADEALHSLRERIDETVSALQETVLRPARDVMAMLQALREVFFGGGERRPGSDTRRRATSEEEDALFIG
jgi:hypothetical protein